jgi:hypothetical protein
MKLRSLLLAELVIDLLFAVVLLLGPAIVLKFFGLTTGKTEVLLAQTLGAALVAFAVLCWFGSELAEAGQARAATVPLLVFNAIAFVVMLLGVLSEVTRAGAAWLLVAIFLVLAAGFAYFQFAGPRE